MTNNSLGSPESDFFQIHCHFLSVFLPVTPMRVESEIHDDAMLAALSAADLAAFSVSPFWAKSACPATQWMFVVSPLLLIAATSF